MKITTVEDTSRRCLAALITNDAVLAHVAPKVTPEEPKPFGDGAADANLIAQWCVEHHRKFGKAPRQEIANYYQRWAEQGTRDKEVYKAIESTLAWLSADYERDALDTDLDGVIKHLTRVRNARFRDTWQDYEGNGKYDRVPGLVQDYNPRYWDAAPAVLRGDEVQAVETSWLWKLWLPRGELVMVTGCQGSGKSLMLADIAARVSSGRVFPSEREEPNAPKNVMIASSEASWPHQYAPRLYAAGADMACIYQAPDKLSLPGDMATLEAACRAKRIRFLIFDVIKSYVGTSKFDDNSEVHVRGLLTPLRDLANRLSMTVAYVVHNRKSAGTAMDRAGGSGAWGRVAQMCHTVGQTETSGDTRILSCFKSQFGPVPVSQGFVVETATASCPLLAKPGKRVQIETARIQWTGESRETADDVAMADMTKRPRGHQMQDAANVIKELLIGGALPSAELEREVRRQTGISVRTFNTACKEAGVKRRKDGSKWFALLQ